VSGREDGVHSLPAEFSPSHAGSPWLSAASAEEPARSRVSMIFRVADGSCRPRLTFHAAMSPDTGGKWDNVEGQKAIGYTSGFPSGRCQAGQQTATRVPPTRPITATCMSADVQRASPASLSGRTHSRVTLPDLYAAIDRRILIGDRSPTATYQRHPGGPHRGR